MQAARPSPFRKAGTTHLRPCLSEQRLKHDPGLVGLRQVPAVSLNGMNSVLRSLSGYGDHDRDRPGEKKKCRQEGPSEPGPLGFDFLALQDLLHAALEFNAVFVAKFDVLLQAGQRPFSPKGRLWP